MNKWTSQRGAMAAFTLSVLMQSCGFVAQENKVLQLNASAEELMKGQDRATQSSATIKTPKPRIAGERVRIKVTELPDTLFEQITFVSKGNQSLLSILEDLSRLIGIPIKTAEIALFAGAAGGTSRPYAGLSSWSVNAGAGSALPSALNNPWSHSSEMNAQGLNFEHKGSVKALLDHLASKGNVSWRFNAQTQSIEFFRFETRTFSVFLPPGVKSLSAGISLTGVSASASSAALSSANSAGSGAGNVSVSQALNINPWGSIMEGVRAILNEGPSSTGTLLGGNSTALNSSNSAQGVMGSSTSSSGLSSLPQGLSAGYSSNAFMAPNAIANPELGMITVTAKPSALERVERYVSSINERFAHNVMIDVKIFSVALDEQNSLGFGLNVMYSSLSQMGARISTPNPLQAGVDTPGILTLSPPTGSTRWSGSSLVAQALSQWGRVALQRQGQVLAVNGQPSPIQVANEISYVASSTTTNAPNVGSSVTQNTGSKVVGFTANFLPLILGDNRILLSYQLQISSLASPLTPNAQGIQTPNIASQSLQQQAFVQDGQAIVLFGYDEKRDGVDSANTIAGYAKSNSQSRQMMVIVLQINTAGVFHDM